MLAPTEEALTDNALVLAIAGVEAGIVIGIVSSMLGVTGGERLIPTLVLLYGVPIKLAGSVSLLISIPTLLVALSGYWRSSLLKSVAERRRLLLIWMAVGSALGAYLGSRLLGVMPQAMLSVLLGLVLFISATKVFTTHAET